MRGLITTPGTSMDASLTSFAFAKEVGDRAGEYGNLGNAYGSQGDFSKAIKYHT